MHILNSIIAAWRRWKWSRLTEGQREVRRVFNQFSSEDKAELMREIRDGHKEYRKFLRRSQKEFSKREDAAAAERRAHLPEIRRKHEEWVKSLTGPKSKRLPYPKWLPPPSGPEPQ